MLRSGPFSDELVVGLLNARFVPFYFDLGRGSPAADDDARAFVVAVKKELGGSAVPTPPVLVMTAEGELVAEVSNYATEEQVLRTLRAALRDRPSHAAPSEAEEGLARLDRARIAECVGQVDRARELLAGKRSAEETLFLAQMARRAGDEKAARAALAELGRARADDQRLERALLAHIRGDYEEMHEESRKYPPSGPRAAEAAYYHGVALYHLEKAPLARETWKALVERHGEHRFSYRADWAYSQTSDSGAAKSPRRFTTSGPRSLLGRHGYMGRRNPDLD